MKESCYLVVKLLEKFVVHWECQEITDKHVSHCIVEYMLL